MTLKKVTQKRLSLYMGIGFCTRAFHKDMLPEIVPEIYSMSLQLSQSHLQMQSSGQHVLTLRVLTFQKLCLCTKTMKAKNIGRTLRLPRSPRESERADSPNNHEADCMTKHAAVPLEPNSCDYIPEHRRPIAGTHDHLQVEGRHWIAEP